MVFNRFACEEFLRLQVMSRSVLAAKSGVTPGYVSDLLNGKKDTPTRAAVNKLAGALGVDPRALYFEPPAEVAA